MELSDIFTLEKLLCHAEILKRNGGKPGFDGMTVDALCLWMQINGSKLLQELLSGTYRPMPAIGFTIAKQNGGYRQLANLTVTDRIIQQCILETLSEKMESVFSPYSYAFRRGRGTGEALKQYCLYGEQFGYASKIDPVACFDHMAHDKLAEAIRQFIMPKKNLWQLLWEYIELPIFIEGKHNHRIQGVLQGAPLSPLFCNLYFHSMDQFLTDQQIPFIRYADDLVLFADSLPAISSFTEAAVSFMQTELKLTVNKSKSKIASPVHLRFLGHDFERGRYGMLMLKAEEKAENAYFAWHESKLRNNHRGMDILSDGVLRQKDYTLFFDTAAGASSLPIMSVDRINIYSSVIFDSGFLQRALDNQVYINIFDRHGRLVGRFTPHSKLKAPMVTYRQMECYFNTAERLKIAKEFVLASIHNFRLNLYYYRKHYSAAIFDLALSTLKTLWEKIKNCFDYEALLLLEASARKEYYDCFDFMIKSEELIFDKRTRRPPRNEINALLSFGNTVLYNIIAFKINQSPLDIRIGYLHATNGFRLESLQLDIAEIFKPLIVDRTVFSLCNLGSILPDHFEHQENGAVYLNQTGKRIFLRALYDKLDSGLTVNERYFSYLMLIDEEIRKLMRYFRKDEPYKAYRQVQ